MSSNESAVVVVGVDGSPDSESAVRWADRYAQATGASLRLVTAWALPRSYGIQMRTDAFDPQSEARAIVERTKSGVSTPAVRVEASAAEGAAGPVLVSASDDAALLVVGGHGHSRIDTLLLGSVSSYCLHHARCPVDTDSPARP